MPPPNGGPVPTEYMQQLIQMLAGGLLQEFVTRLPPGLFIDPRTPVVVVRTNDDGVRVNAPTNMIQQIAELNDNIKYLSELMEEELDEVNKAKSKRRRRD